jgi:hypothetical protein
MNGGLDDINLLIFIVRSDGDSSNSKAFSTERRKKKVLMRLNGSIIRFEIFLCKLLEAM